MVAGPDQLLSAELAAVPDGAGKRDGIVVGRAVAVHLLTLRSTDGSAATPPPFVPGTQPGDYQPTPPKFPAPMFTNWGAITPFVLSKGSQFRPVAPPPVTSAAYAAALNEVKSLGQDSSTARTADQTVLAKFWGPPRSGMCGPGRAEHRPRPSRQPGKDGQGFRRARLGYCRQHHFAL